MYERRKWNANIYLLRILVFRVSMRALLVYTLARRLKRWMRTRTLLRAAKNGSEGTENELFGRDVAEAYDAYSCFVACSYANAEKGNAFGARCIVHYHIGAEETNASARFIACSHNDTEEEDDAPKHFTTRCYAA